MPGVMSHLIRCSGVDISIRIELLSNSNFVALGLNVLLGEFDLYFGFGIKKSCMKQE